MVESREVYWCRIVCHEDGGIFIIFAMVEMEIGPSWSSICCHDVEHHPPWGWIKVLMRFVMDQRLLIWEVSGPPPPRLRRVKRQRVQLLPEIGSIRVDGDGQALGIGMR